VVPEAMGGRGGGKRRGNKVAMAAVAMRSCGTCNLAPVSGRPIGRLELSVDRHPRHVQDRAAKSCFINDMVKKHLPVTKLLAARRTKCARLFSCRSSAWASGAVEGRFARELRGLALTGPRLPRPHAAAISRRIPQQGTCGRSSMAVERTFSILKRMQPSAISPVRSMR